MRRIAVSLPKGRPVTFRYPKDPLGRVPCAVKIAVAQAQGNVGPLVAGLESELAALDRNKPVLPLHAFGPPSGHEAHRPADRASRWSEGSSTLVAARRSAKVVLSAGAILQSWRLLLTLPIGLTTWAAFWYAGRRAKQVDLQCSAVGYAVVLIVGLVLGGIGLSAAAGGILAIMWMVGIVHALIVRRRVVSAINA